MTGDLEGFEEASRAFFAQDYERMDTLVEVWPSDIRNHVRKLVQRLRALEGGSGRAS